MPKFTWPQIITAVLVALFLIGAGIYAFYGRTPEPEPVPPGDTLALDLTGKLVPGGAECQLFQSRDGKTYAVQGTPLSNIKEGEPIEIKGTLQEASFCMQGEGTIAVSEVRRLDPANAGTGTLKGHADIGPICPVERPGIPCEPSPETYKATHILVYASDGKLVKDQSLDSKGDYSYVLAAGDYTLTYSGIGIPGSRRSYRVSVRAGETAVQNLDIDTGIR